MTIDPMTIGLGIGGFLLFLILIRFIFGKKKLNAMATELTKIRDSDHIPEPVEVPPADPSATAPEGAGFTRTLSMRERILLHLRFVATTEDSTTPTVVQAVASVVDGEVKTLCDALQLLQESGEIINEGVPGSAFSLSTSGRERANVVHGDYMASTVSVAGEEVVVGDVVGFGGFPLIGPHIQSQFGQNTGGPLSILVRSFSISFEDGEMSSDERRMIDNLVEELSISDDQAKDIESYVKAAMGGQQVSEPIEELLD